PTASEIRWLRSFHLPTPKHSWSPAGCDKCNGLGYFDRTGVFELWHLRESDYRLILRNSDEHTLRQHFHRSQDGSLLKDGLAKVAAGVTSLTELRRASSGAFPFDSLEGSIQSQET